MEKEVLNNFIKGVKKDIDNDKVDIDSVRKITEFIYDNDLNKSEIERLYIEVGDNGKSESELFKCIVKNVLSCQPLSKNDGITKKLVKYIDKDVSPFSSSSVPFSTLLSSNFRYDISREMLLGNIKRYSFDHNEKGVFVWVAPMYNGIVSSGSGRYRIYSLKSVRHHLLSTTCCNGVEKLFFPYESILNIRFFPLLDSSGNFAGPFAGDIIYRKGLEREIKNELVWRRGI